MFLIFVYDLWSRKFFFYILKKFKNILLEIRINAVPFYCLAGSWHSAQEKINDKHNLKNTALPLLQHIMITITTWTRYEHLNIQIAVYLHHFNLI